ncbi:MAG: succinate dehydrogenase, cytochrome b556 subunit [Candidatus Acidoferrales bacterium]
MVPVSGISPERATAIETDSPPKIKKKIQDPWHCQGGQGIARIADCRGAHRTPGAPPAAGLPAGGQAGPPVQLCGGRSRRKGALLSMYRGGPGQWAWLLHRWSGVAVLLFLLIHILDTGLVLFGPQVYDKVVGLYTHPVFRVGEVGLVAAVLYHALNGIRITLIDFYPELTERQRPLFYAVVSVFVLLFLPTAYLMLETVLW